MPVTTVYEDAGVGTEIGHVYRVSGDLNNTVEFSLELMVMNHHSVLIIMDP